MMQDRMVQPGTGREPRKEKTSLKKFQDKENINLVGCGIVDG